jgi:hypothetical protein
MGSLSMLRGGILIGVSCNLTQEDSKEIAHSSMRGFIVEPNVNKKLGRAPRNLKTPLIPIR